eukprot:634740-Rhodomonas_salina.1
MRMRRSRSRSRRIPSAQKEQARQPRERESKVQFQAIVMCEKKFRPGRMRHMREEVPPKNAAYAGR